MRAPPYRGHPLRPVAAIAALCLLYGLARVLSPAWRGTWWWGVDLPRDLPPWTNLVGAACFAVVLLPPLARVVQRAWSAGERRVRRHGCAGTVAAVALVVALAPDRTQWVGDALLRQGLLQLPARFDAMFPQALPLDALLHWTLPRALAAPLHADPNLAIRALGVLEAALYAWWAWAFAAAVRARGTTRALVVAVVLGGAVLALFTGYSKPTVEIALLALGVARYGVVLVRTGRGRLGVALCAALALGLHRVGVALIPGAVAAWLLAPRAVLGRRAETIAALGVAAAGALAFGPRIVRLFFGFDLATNVASPIARAQGGVLAAAFSPQHLMDLLQVALFLAPAAILIPVLRPRASARDRAAQAFLIVLAAGFVPIALFVQVTQGAFRDWDVFAGAGVALACWTGWRLAHHRAPLARHAIAPAVLAIALVPAAQLLVHDQMPDRALARARAFALGPPPRPLHEGATWDYIGLRSMKLERWDDARDAFRHLADAAPHERALLLWGTAAILDRHFAEALDAFRRLETRNPANPLGPFGAWVAAANLGDSAARDRALAAVNAFPDSIAAPRIQMHLAYYPALEPYVAAASGH